MAQTTYEEYLANLMSNINPQGGMVTGQPTPPPQMAMPDISAIQQAMQGVRDVNQGYVAPQMTDLAKFRTDFEEGRRQVAEDILAQSLGVTPSGGMLAGSDSSNVELTPEQMAYFDIETPAERDFRMQQVQRALTPGWFQAVLGMGAPVSSGQTNYNIRSEDLKREVARRQVAAQQAAAARATSGGGGGDYSSYEGAGMAQTQASLQSDNTRGFYG